MKGHLYYLWFSKVTVGTVRLVLCAVAIIELEIVSVAGWERASNTEWFIVAVYFHKLGMIG